jgi:acetoin utilization deacetylase AcuC-like enzyme
MRTTPIFYHHDQAVEYDSISTNKIPEFVRQSGRFPIQPSDLEASALYVAHDRRYVNGVMDGTIVNGFGNTDLELARYALGSVASLVGAAEHALQGRSPVACSASQGFHHAHWDEGNGYCTFNGLMVVAAHQLRKGAVDQVLIIDGDGHYGDGTADIIDLLDFEGRVVNITRPDIGKPVQSNWNTEMWRSFTKDLIQSVKPGIILYQAGADAWDLDPYCAGYLSKEGLAARDRGIFTAARDAGVPLVWNLAGGYADPMQDTINIHLQTLAISDEVYYDEKSAVVP